MASNLARLDSMLDRAIKRMLKLENILPETTDKCLSDLGHQYGLAVITNAGTTDGNITFNPINQTQKKICGELLTSELGLYDPDAIKACQLQRLILCNNLRREGCKLNGLAEIGRFVMDTLVFNAAAISTQWERARATLHHEIFHAIDYRDDFLHYADRGWRELNGHNYKYNVALQSNAGAPYDKIVYFPPFNFEDIRKIPKGFLNKYATESVLEDKAVVYSWIMVRYMQLQAIAQRDSITAAKLAYMKNLLSEFHHSFNDELWQKLAQRSQVLRGTKYEEWKKRIITLEKAGF